jgi:hypothetical protein
MRLKRLLTLSLLFGAGLGLTVADSAAAQPFFPGAGGPRRGRVVAPRLPVPAFRAPAVIHPSRTVKRPPRPVIVRPPRVERRHRVTPRVFLPAVVFGGVVVVERHERGYRRDRGFTRESLVWQDSETLYREDEWTEFTLDCEARGTKLWFEILEGRLQADWAEVVFEDGEVQVVEFPDRRLGPGLYELLDFRQGRRVDYVRMVAQASTREATLTLWLER